ncbi:MAG: PAS domain S-box protein [Phycisphaerales bacterium]|nr:MAG: PAS domain S-box protein [Phycisphaerales bacterium]
MARVKEPPKSSLRNNAMVAFFLTIILLGISITAMSHHILRRALHDGNLSAESVQRIGQQVTQMLTGATIAGTLVAIAIATLLSRRISEPLRRLLAGAAEIGAGHLDTHLDISGDDELGQLAAAFNDMAEKLKQSHDHLEATVAERTAELTQRNQELQTEMAERRRTEEQLRRSEERFTIMADSAQDAIMMMDPAGHVTFYNKTAQSMFGWTAAEAIGKDLHSLIAPPTLRPASREGLARFRHSGEGAAVGKTLELTALRKNGTEFPIEISLAGVKLNQEWHAIGIVRDITARKRSEEALRESEQRSQDILNSILAGVLIIDPETQRILDVNESAAKLVGRSKAEMIGQLCHEFVCPIKCGKCPVTDLGQTLDESEGVLLKADGESLPIIKSVTDATFQGRRCLLESFVPIVQQKQAEEKLKESLSLLQATLESTADGILVTDTTGQYKNFNNQFKELWHLPDRALECLDRDEALAIALEQLTDPESFRAEFMALRGQPERQSQGLLHRKDGSVVEYCSKPQYVTDEIVGRVLSFRDITEKYHAQQGQERLLRRVAEINEELTHFAYVVSHDLKAPLRGIKLLTEWLCTDYGDQLGDEARENLDLLQNRVDRMHNLIEGVLQYSRVGRIEEDRIEVDLNALLPEVIDAIAPPEHVTITVEGTLPHIECEPTRISQVFQNLLTNAVKYMDKPVGEISVACTEEAGAWRFSITDNGPGIEARYFDRIFKIFQTLRPRDEYESTGVGLTLVKKIVETYGGRIWVESEVGKGSTFFFTFPKRHVESQNDATPTDIALHNERVEETVVTSYEQ